MARPTGSCPPGRKPLLSDRETALGRRSFRPSPCRGRHPSSPRRRGGSNIHSYFWPMWLKYSFPLVAQILVPTWLKYSLTFTALIIIFRHKPLCKLFDVRPESILHNCCSELVGKEDELPLTDNQESNALLQRIATCSTAELQFFVDQLPALRQFKPKR